MYALIEILSIFVVFPLLAFALAKTERPHWTFAAFIVPLFCSSLANGSHELVSLVWTLAPGVIVVATAGLTSSRVPLPPPQSQPKQRPRASW